MRYRFRYSPVIPGYFYQDNYVREDLVGGTWVAKPPVIGVQSTTSHRYVLADAFSRIWDSIEPPAKDVAKACLHISSKTSLTNLVYLSYTTHAGSSTRFNHTIISSPASFYANLMSLADGSNLSNQFTGTTVGQRTQGGIPDIVALLDNYDLQLKSYFSNKVDVGENIAEPDVFLEAIRLVVAPRVFLKRFVSLVSKHYGKQLHGKNFGEVIKHFSKDVSGGYLSWVFGYKPVIKDLKAAFNAHRNIERRLNYLRSKQGNFIKVHSRQLLNSGEPFAPLDSNGFLGTTAVKREGNGILSVSCEARVRTDIDLTQTFASYAEYFGLNDVIGLSWDLIPFSFVVDWMTNFGTWWHKATRLNFGGPFSQIKNQCYTSNCFDSLDIHVKSGSSSFLGTTVYSTDRLARVVTKRYERELSLPDEVLLANLSRWSVFQNITSGALLTQRIPDGLRLFKSR